MLRCVLLLAMGAIAVSARAEETMRITVGEPAPAVDVEAEGLVAGDDVEDPVYAALTQRQAHLTAAAGKLVLDGRDTGAQVMRLRAGSPRGWVKANRSALRGDVVVTAVGSRLQVVNVLPLEDYLVGVLGSEMPPSFPFEALKAQAVAARTYALKKKIDGYGQSSHLGSNVISQVYGGLKAETASTRQAVEATRGEVLTFQLQPIEAYFHSSCGGRTESGLPALNRELPYLTPVECPCGQLPSSRWSLRISRQELDKAIHAEAHAFSISSRSSTGRVTRVQWGKGSLDAISLRARLGYGRLKSLAFDVEETRDGWQFTGKGFGHGAGLCQWGAKLLAEKGWDYRRILAHYYPQTEVQTLY
ncbi:MAG: SpoIID/LytB domain-containing protein [Myxococcaceae bacterium]|nr:SpoIID/LytB domain-containing protein [Myxococcaceae bacterium]